MPIAKHLQKDALILTPGEKVTVSETGEELSEAVKTAVQDGIRKVIFDLSRVEFMDSLGVGQIVASYVSLKNQGGHLILCGLKPRILFVLQMASLHHVLDIREALPTDLVWE